MTGVSLTKQLENITYHWEESLFQMILINLHIDEKMFLRLKNIYAIIKHKNNIFQTQIMI